MVWACDETSAALRGDAEATAKALASHAVIRKNRDTPHSKH